MSGAELSTASYWDERYAEADGETPTHEWFRSFEALRPFFQKHLFEQFPADGTTTILHLGSGDSTIPYDFAHLNYTNQTCLDFSTTVVQKMSSTRPSASITWLEGDVRSMPSAISSSSISVAFDKGTLDAMIHGSPWDPPDDVMQNAKAYMSEVQRVLEEQGVFLYVTYRQPHFIRPLLNAAGEWAEVEMETLGDGEGFDYFGWVLRKRALKQQRE